MPSLAYLVPFCLLSWLSLPAWAQEEEDPPPAATEGAEETTAGGAEEATAGDAEEESAEAEDASSGEASIRDGMSEAWSQRPRSFGDLGRAMRDEVWGYWPALRSPVADTSLLRLTVGSGNTTHLYAAQATAIDPEQPDLMEAMRLDPTLVGVGSAELTLWPKRGSWGWHSSVRWGGYPFEVENKRYESKLTSWDTELRYRQTLPWGFLAEGGLGYRSTATFLFRYPSELEMVLEQLPWRSHGGSGSLTLAWDRGPARLWAEGQLLMTSKPVERGVQAGLDWALFDHLLLAVMWEQRWNSLLFAVGESELTVWDDRQGLVFSGGWTF